MNMAGNTVLITGGTSGIGLELAMRFAALGNTVVVTGKDRAKLERVGREQPTLHTVESDVSDPAAIGLLSERMRDQFPTLNVLVNNAGVMRKINLQDRGSDLQDIGREIETNLLGPVRMVKQFLPQLKAQPKSAIVNVTSGLAFVPYPISPVYSATKAGLHSFTESLRVQLKGTAVRVFELAPPATRTALLDAFTAEDGKGAPVMDVHKLGAEAMKGLQRDRLEIRPGASNLLKAMSRIAPGMALRMTSGPVDAMLAETRV